jgi:hypothetical protein
MAEKSQSLLIVIVRLLNLPAGSVRMPRGRFVADKSARTFGKASSGRFDRQKSVDKKSFPEKF